MKKYPKKFIDKLKAVTSKRPKTVIDYILKHGSVTTEQLKELGYEHPPRAASDVKDLGIPLETVRIKGTSGRSIAAYRFGDVKKVDYSISKVSGRKALPKALKKALIAKYGSKCFIYMQPMEERLLQIDHRVPYAIGGEQDTNNPDCFMLLSPSANRAKSWTCEHCPNWEKKDSDFCVKCFWAHPENYTHIAGREQRQIVITFTGNEIEDYNRLVSLVGLENAEATIKDIIAKHVK